MRSHSRADLYAKTAALSGLGCLALAGAVVDSWPAVRHLPDVPSVITGERSATVTTLVELAGLPVEPTSVTIDLAPRPSKPRPIPVSRYFAGVAPTVELAAAPEPPAPSVGPLSVDVDADVTRLALATVTLSVVPEPEPIAPEPVAVMAFDRQDVEDDGFLSSALKKTGASVGSSIGKAGSSLVSAGQSVVGAFRFVGGAVKRVF